jgi:hypothetical protein
MDELLQKTLHGIIKSQSDTLEFLKTIETNSTSLREFLEDMSVDHVLGPDEVAFIEDKLIEIRKQLKRNYDLQEGTDLRVQKLASALKKVNGNA